MLIQSVAEHRASFRVCNSHSDLARCPSRDEGNDHEQCLSDVHSSQVRLPMHRLTEFGQSAEPRIWPWTIGSGLFASRCIVRDAKTWVTGARV